MRETVESSPCPPSAHVKGRTALILLIGGLVFLLVIAVGCLAYFRACATNYGIYSIGDIELVDSLPVDVPKEHFETMLSLTRIDSAQCPRFAVLLRSSKETITLTPQDLMILYLSGYDAREATRAEIEADGPVSISYDWRTTVLSVGRG